MTLLRCLTIIFLFQSFLLFPQNSISSGTSYYVSTNGNDLNTGTSLTSPFRTIQKAADVAVAGDTVFIRGGTYHQKFSPVHSGNAISGYITYSSYPGETAILDGSGVSLDSQRGEREGLVNIVGKNYIRVRRLTVKDAPYHGISVRYDFYTGSKPSHIEISWNQIYDTYDTAIKLNRAYDVTIKNNTVKRVLRSSGIGSWSSDRVIIQNNKIENAHIYSQSQGGHEESLTVASTTNFDVSYNEVSMAGYEGHLGNEGIDVKESSRYGRVHHNYIHDFGPVFGGAIYVDAWKAGLNDTLSLSNIDIYNNFIENTANGIVLGSEQGGTNENIDVYNNVIYNTGAVGIGIPKRTPSNWRIREGMKRNFRIYNNTIVKARWNGGAGIYVTSTRIQNIRIKNNIVYFNNHNGLITAGSSASLPHIAADHNLVFGPTRCATDFPTCVEISKNPPGYPLISGNTTANPRFLSRSAPDFHLGPASPAIDQGADFSALFRFDHDGAKRPHGAAFDIGAYEYNPDEAPPARTGTLRTGNLLFLHLPGISMILDWEHSIGLTRFESHR